MDKEGTCRRKRVYLLLSIFALAVFLWAGSYLVLRCTICELDNAVLEEPIFSYPGVYHFYLETSTGWNVFAVPADRNGTSSAMPLKTSNYIWHIYIPLECIELTLCD